jgi:bacterioferritin
LDKNQIIARLNWFYTLELNQVDLYITQSKKVADQYTRKVLERSAQIEEQHALNISAKLKELGAKPTLLGDVLGPLTGKIGGHVIPLVGLKNMLKANVMLEQKAMADYKKFISSLKGEKGLVDLLWTHLIDEDLHASWFESKAKELEMEPQ